MKIPKFLDDLSVISKLGDNPGADNGLTAEGLKAKFDEASLKLQAFLNDTLIEKINSLFSLDAPPHEGMNMTGPINMNKNKLGGLADPTDGGDAVNLKFANENYRATMDYAKKVGNPHNLLDNSDFRNPVNQRGQKSYSGFGVYAIDRWKIGNTAFAGFCTLSDVGITLSAETDSNDFEQRLENYGRMKGNKYTIAYKDSNGVVYCLPFTMGGCTGETIGNITFYSIDTRDILFRIPAGVSVTIVWAVLYEGEYTAETLPEYQPKGYGAELAECMRYYQQSFMDTPKNTANLKLVFGANVTWTNTVNFAVPMRCVPTVTIYNNITGNANEMCIWHNDEPVSDVVAGAVGINSFIPQKHSGITINLAYGLHYTASADL